MSRTKPRRATAPRADAQAAAAILALVNAVLTGQPVDEATLAAFDPRTLQAALAQLKAGALRTFPDAGTHASTPVDWSPAFGKRLAARGRR